MAGMLGMGPAHRWSGTRVTVCARAQSASRGGGGGRGFPTSEQVLQLLTLWTFPDTGTSVALDVAQRRETQHGQASVEHFTHSV